MKSEWRAWKARQFAHIDARSLRERAILFLLLICGCMALADVLWLEPALMAHKQLTERFAKQNTELQRLRDALKMVAKPVDKNLALHTEIAALNSRLVAVNQSIKEVAPDVLHGAPLAQVLVHLLRRHEGLTLVLTSTVLPETATPKTAQMSQVNATAAATAMAVGLKRQGIELIVSGDYSELTRYVRTLETALPYARWGVMKVKRDKGRPELTLQLFLVGATP